MELNDRKKLILKAIIANYLETGEPVGSRTIAKHPELNLSSATIRKNSFRHRLSFLCRSADDGT